MRRMSLKAMVSVCVLATLLTACGGGGDSGSAGTSTSTSSVLPAPSALSYSSPQSYTVGTAIAVLSPTITGTVTGYSVAPALPAGLALNATGGQISGTPTVASAQATYTVTASNGAGFTTFGLTIVVAAAVPAPSALSYPSPQSYVTGTAITTLVPTVTGSVSSYAVTPSLPAGLALNTTTGQVSGTPTAVTPQAAYTVTASNGSGSTTFALSITVAAPTFTVGGTVAGLSGAGLVLHNSNGENLPIAANGAFSFSTRLGAGTAYAITVSSQPAGPTQNCVVTNAAGTVTTGAIANILVTCTTNAYTVGGVVSGLTSTGLVLRNNASQDVTINSSGSFVFPGTVASGGTYSVQILTQPQAATQNCFVTNSSRTGTVTSLNVTTVAVTCTDVGRFAYVGSGGNLADVNASSGIYGYSINSGTGALAPLAGSPFATPTPTSLSMALSVTPNGKFAYVANSSAKTITAYAINSVTGALAPAAGPYATATPTYTSTVDPTGKFAYFTSLSGNSVYAYAVDGTTGALTAVPGSPFALGGSPTAFATNRSGTVAYIPISSGPSVSVASFNISPSTGALSLVAGSAVAGGSGIAVDPGGAFAYTLDTNAKTVSTHPLNATTGVLGARIGTPVSAGTFPNHIDIEPSGRFVLVSSGSLAAPGLLIYGADPATGALTPVLGSPFVDGGIHDNPLAIAVDPAGKFLYVGNDISKNISAFTFGATTGVAVAVSGSPFATGFYPDSMAISR